MSVIKTGRRQRHYAPQVRYQPFGDLPEAVAAAPSEARLGAVQRHLDWLLANMDWFALQGRATLQTASAALHRDLAKLESAADTDAPDVEALQARVAEQEQAIAELHRRMLLHREKALDVRDVLQRYFAPHEGTKPYQKEKYEHALWLLEIIYKR